MLARFISLLLLLLSIVLIINLFGCSPVRSHKALTFFFDGVPGSTETLAVTGNPRARPDTSKAIGIPSKTEISTINYHKPYMEKKCGICHDQNTMGKFLKPQPSLCYQCHDDFSRKYKVVHGPAAGGYCTACHEPHLAKTKKLLKRANQQLCFYCHSAPQVLKNKAHKDIADANCTTCHNPHGGRDRIMLK